MIMTIPLSKLAHIETGRRPKGGVRGIKSGVPSIGGEHLNSDGGFKFESIKYIPESFADTMKQGLIKCGDILIVKDGATTGKTSFVGAQFPFERAFVNEHVFIVRPDRGRIIPEYLYWYLRSPQGLSQIMLDFRGAAQGGITRKFADKIEVPMRPLEDQRRITDSLHLDIKTIGLLISQLDVISKQKATLHSSILKKACEGRLVSTEAELAHKEGRDYEPADQLLGRTLAERRTRFETENPRKKYKEPVKPDTAELPNLPEGWCWASFDQCAIEFQNGIYKKKEFYCSDGIACLRMYNIEGSSIVWKDIKRMDLTPEELTKFELVEGDLLINRVNSMELVGKSAVILGFGEPVVYESKNIRVRVDSDHILPHYIQLWLQHYGPKYHSSNFQQTTGMASINQTQLKNMPIPLPPFPEQQRIIVRMDEVGGHLERTENLIIDLDSDLDVLINSILNDVFPDSLRGKTVVSIDG